MYQPPRTAKTLANRPLSLAEQIRLALITEEVRKAVLTSKLWVDIALTSVKPPSSGALPVSRPMPDEAVKGSGEHLLEAIAVARGVTPAFRATKPPRRGLRI